MSTANSLLRSAANPRSSPRTSIVPPDVDPYQCNTFALYYDGMTESHCLRAVRKVDDHTLARRPLLP